MASKKKQAEGIALLSMYNDEDDEEMEDIEQQQQQQQQQQIEEEVEEEKHEYNRYLSANDMEEDSRISDDDDNDDDDDKVTSPTIPNENYTPKDSRFPIFSPQQQQQQQQQEVSRTSRGGRFTIVDYGHDELAMSPEPEEGEIGSSGRVVFGSDLQTANVGDIQEKTPPGTVQVLTPSVQATPQSSEHLELSQPDTMNSAVTESEAVEAEGAVNVSVENVDPLDRFLPLPPKGKCPEELQKKIEKFLYLKKIGKSFNAEVRNRKDYRNPDFLLHAVTYQDIDQIGSCFSKDVFDPHGYDKSDYYTEIEADMKRERERKEQELKKSPKVEFVSIGTQPGTVAGAPKFNVPISGVSAVAAGGLPSVPTAADAVARDGRQNKKSKWDKVDCDRRNPLPSGGQDSLSAVGTHAALLPATNAGAGYTAFVQQRRREAEEKRSSERKLDRRS